MGKRSRVKARAEETAPGEVGPRQPCPCGSGRRYKACHGSTSGAPAPFVARPFAGMAGECDLVALREFVPAATAPLTLKDSDRSVQLCSLLPGAAPALVREGGAIWLGLQVQHAYGDASRELGAVLLAALEAEPGVVGLMSDPGEGPRLQDLLADDALDVTVHEGFDYWVADLDEDPAMAAVLEQANAAAAPTVRLEGEPAAYWTSVGDREFLRWVMPHDEDPLLDALARLHHAGSDVLVEGSRLIGMFRACGLLVPVWDLPVGTGAAALAEPAAAFSTLLDATLEKAGPLTSEERSTRAGLASRQLTLR